MQLVYIQNHKLGYLPQEKNPEEKNEMEQKIVDVAKLLNSGGA